MALFNSFKFGDVDSKDYGVYISGDSVYDSPARSVDLVQVPGRNGALALDNGYYENIEVTYPAGSFGTSQEEWREKMLGIRNALAAQRGYQKLIDTYHPEHYRLGMFFAGISASPVQYNRAGQFPIRFNCKPQRFLVSGDEAVEFTAEGQEEVYGPDSIVSFEAEEGAEIRQLEVDLEPVQDLNGYDNPWPAGGGKNLLPNQHIGDAPTTSNGLTFTTNADGSVKITGTASANTYYYLWPSNQTIIVPAGSYATLLANTQTNGVSLQLRIGTIAGPDISDAATYTSRTFTTTETKNVTGRIFVANRTALGTNGVTLYPMLAVSNVALTVADFAPYSNLCPISGHTEANVTRAGKNLADFKDGYSIAPNGAVVAYGTRAATVDPISIKSGVQYKIVFGGNAQSCIYAVYNGTTLVRRLASIISGTVLNTEGGTSLRVCVYAAESTTVTAESGQAMVVIASETDLSYEPYAGQTYPIPLGQTVYGGTLNVTTGVLTVDRKYVLYDGSSDEDWGRFKTGSAGAYAMRIGAPDISQSASEANAMSNYLPAIAGNATWGNYDYFIATTTNAAIFTGIRSITTVDAWRAYLAQNNLQVVYKLATPTTVQLTPTQVSTLLGQNNIWADSGEVEVKVASPVDLTNPTNFPAKPLIRVYGNGSVRVGDTIATVQNNAEGYVDIDCESMNCYDTTGGRNADVSFSGNDFPELASGDNGILLTGPSKVEITPRWWEL